jgi:hypothetical protein
MVEHMQKFVISADEQQAKHLPQDVEEGYNVMKEMQQVLPLSASGPTS